jgi:hypothetical protein
MYIYLYILIYTYVLVLYITIDQGGSVRRGVTLSQLRDLHAAGLALRPVNVSLESRQLTAAVAAAEDWAARWAPELARIGIERVTRRSIASDSDSEEGGGEGAMEGEAVETSSMEIVASQPPLPLPLPLPLKEFSAMLSAAQDMTADFPELR